MVRGALLLVLFLGACTQEGLDSAAPAPALDRDYFRCNVQPVIAARCSFMECHGSALRPYAVYSVQRMRLGVPWTEQTLPLTDPELAANYEASRNFAATSVGEAQLLTKPLDVAAGGMYHEGRELYGGVDVFTDTSDRGYQLIEGWLGGATASANCDPVPEVGR